MAMTEGDLEELDRWGSRYTAEEPPCELVRLANVVRRLIDPVTPVAVAAFKVINALAALTNIEDVFELQRGKRAAPIQASDVWRYPLNMSERYILRGVQHRDGDELWQRLAASFADIEVEVDQTDVAGRKGLIICLRWSWSYKLKARADLDAGLAGRIAIRLADAEHLLCLLRPQTNAAVSGDHPNNAPAGPRAAVEIKASKAKGEVWSESDPRLLLTQFTSLTTGSGRIQAKAAHGVLADVWGIKPNSIRVYLVKARELPIDDEMPQLKAAA